MYSYTKHTGIQTLTRWEEMKEIVTLTTAKFIRKQKILTKMFTPRDI